MTEGESGFYTIEVGGHLDARYTHWFEDMAIRTGFSGTEPITILSGNLVDQAALFGLLSKLQAMNIVLLALSRSQDVPER